MASYQGWWGCNQTTSGRQNAGYQCSHHGFHIGPFWQVMSAAQHDHPWGSQRIPISNIVSEEECSCWPSLTFISLLKHNSYLLPLLMESDIPLMWIVLNVSVPTTPENIPSIQYGFTHSTKNRRRWRSKQNRINWISRKKDKCHWFFCF